MSAYPIKSFAVLGAGITGLVAAHRIHQRGHRVRIFEQSGRAGGAVLTERVGEWLVESGPNSLLSGEPALASLIEELGLTPQVVHASASAKHRYVVRKSRLVAAPLSPGALLASPLFSFGGKLGILSDLVSRPRVRTTDVSLAEFMRGHFGPEFVDYALDPMVSGVYAGNSARLSARYAFPKIWEMEQRQGSLIRGQMAQSKERRLRGEPRPEIFSFKDGVQTLTHALLHGLPPGCVALNASLEAITPGEKWSVIWNQADGTHTQAFDGLVTALPAHALARLRIGSLGERPLAALDGVEHPPVSSLFLGFDRDQVRHPLDGFGMLVPNVEKRSMLGVLFSSSLFPGRAPARSVAMTVMIGGTRQPELASRPTDELVRLVVPELAELLGVNGAPRFVRHTYWPRAIPQYNLGHEQYVSVMTQVERHHRGLHIGGQARDGISVPACIAAGEKLASRAIG
ncbi:MAG: protoporphyrinogen oxidase [Opitutus sp.]